MEERVLLFLLLLTLCSVSVSGQYGDRFAVDGYSGNEVDSGGCPDFGPMDSFNAEGLQRGKVRVRARNQVDMTLD